VTPSCPQGAPKKPFQASHADSLVDGAVVASESVGRAIVPAIVDIVVRCEAVSYVDDLRANHLRLRQPHLPLLR